MFIKITEDNGLRNLINVDGILSVSEEKDGESTGLVVKLKNGDEHRPRESFDRIRIRIEESLEESRIMRVILDGENDEELGEENE